MASQACRACSAPMDPRDGHRDCPACLGLTHVREDVECPCMAALELPLFKSGCVGRSGWSSRKNQGFLLPRPQSGADRVQGWVESKHLLLRASMPAALRVPRRGEQ